MFKCKVCGTELPDGTTDCTSCKVHQEPPAKFMPGTIVKIVLDEWGIVYYFHVTSSYYNHNHNMRMYNVYRDSSNVAQASWREDCLQPVSKEEIARINTTGLLKTSEYGGFEHPLMEGVNM